jgi:hypothetical protein
VFDSIASTTTASALQRLYILYKVYYSGFVVGGVYFYAVYLYREDFCTCQDIDLSTQFMHNLVWTAEAVWRLAVDWTVWGSSYGGSERFFFYTLPDRACGTPSFLVQRVTLPFVAGKAAGAWRLPPTSSSAKVKNEWNYTTIPPVCLYSMLREDYLLC